MSRCQICRSVNIILLIIVLIMCGLIIGVFESTYKYYVQYKLNYHNSYNLDLIIFVVALQAMAILFGLFVIVTTIILSGFDVNERLTYHTYMNKYKWCILSVFSALCHLVINLVTVICGSFGVTYRIVKFGDVSGMFYYSLVYVLIELVLVGIQQNIFTTMCNQYILLI